MRLFEESAERAALYTSFLTVKGKTMLDAIVVKPRLAGQTSDDMEYWVDIDEADADPLRKHLRRYAMRKNIKIEDISHIIRPFSIQSLLGVNEYEGNKEGHFFAELQDKVEMFESEEFPGLMETDVAAFVDPRTVAQGVRVLCAEESFNFEGEGGEEVDGFGAERTLLTDPSQQYDFYRMCIGLLEGGKEMGN